MKRLENFGKKNIQFLKDLHDKKERNLIPESKLKKIAKNIKNILHDMD